MLHHHAHYCHESLATAYLLYTFLFSVDIYTFFLSSLLLLLPLHTILTRSEGMNDYHLLYHGYQAPLDEDSRCLSRFLSMSAVHIDHSLFFFFFSFSILLLC